ncbi:MAG: alpha/beta hydrolase-fold protein [Chryseolinea sp.]
MKIFNVQNCRPVLFLLLSVLSACDSQEKKVSGEASQVKNDPNEIFSYYSEPETKMVYSESVSDSFKIFTSLPNEYNSDTTSTYPLILVLDANAYFESVVAELKLSTLTQGQPKSIVVGIGYKNFWAMDSLRNRDYTYPIAPPEDEFVVSGGAEKFKNFIDNELLTKSTKQYRVNKNQVILMGHSLGGYFVLYHMFNSFEESEYSINNYISVSPSLSYVNQYVLKLEKKLRELKKPLPVKLYVSTGSLEQSEKYENLFLKLKTQMESSHYDSANLKFVEFGNFEHMDSAMPGFMKGLVFVFEK